MNKHVVWSYLKEVTDLSTKDIRIFRLFKPLLKSVYGDTREVERRTRQNEAKFDKPSPEAAKEREELYERAKELRARPEYKTTRRLARRGIIGGEMKYVGNSK